MKGGCARAGLSAGPSQALRFAPRALSLISGAAAARGESAGGRGRRRADSPVLLGALVIKAFVRFDERMWVAAVVDAS
jgi:hypothetical protein